MSKIASVSIALSFFDMRNLFYLYCMLALCTHDLFAQQTERWILSVGAGMSNHSFGGKQIKQILPSQNWEVWEITPEEKHDIMTRGAHIIRLVEPDVSFFASGLPNDPMIEDQWFHNNQGQSGGTLGKDIAMNQAWEVETGDQNVVVGVLDSGIDWKHPERK